jgi:hypothetical protein
MTADRIDHSGFNPVHYPRSYRFTRWVQWVMALMGAGVTGGCLLLSVSILSGSDTPQGPKVLLATLLGAVSLLGLYLIVSAVRYQVTLDADAIEIAGAIRHRLILRRDIRGIRRRVAKNNTASWTVVVNDGAGRNLQLSRSLNTDREFFAWLKSFPDLDRETEDAAARELTDAIRVLEARGVGVGAQRWLRHFATALGAGSYALLFVLLLLPAWQTVLIWVAIAWPWVTLVLVARFQPFYRFGGGRGGQLPDLSMGLFFPGLALALVVLNALHAVHWWTPLIVAAMGSVLLVALAWWADPWLRRQRWTAPALALLCCAYGYGAGLELDALLDASAPTFYPVHVLSRHINRGRHTSYHLEVSSWGPISGTDDITVPRDRYARTRLGDTLCTALHRGALGIPWYTLTDCPASER